MDIGREYSPGNINPERYGWGEATGNAQEDRIFFANVDTFQDKDELQAIIVDLEKRLEANKLHAASTGSATFDKSIDAILESRLDVLRIRLKELKGEYYGGGGTQSPGDYYRRLSEIKMNNQEDRGH